MQLEMPEVYTKHLFLRPIEEGDACDLYEYYKDSRVMQYVSGSVHTSIDETLHMIKTWELPYARRGVPQTWVMEHLQQGKVIGHLNIHTIEDDVGEIGYMLHHAYWHQGYMQEAIAQLVEIGFTHIGLRRIEAQCAIENEASIQLLKCCNFHREGIRRQFTRLSDACYHDMVLMSILKEEWILEERI